MRVGAQLRAGKGLLPALERAEEIGAEVVQIFTQSPRVWKPTQYAPEVLAGYRAAQQDCHRVGQTFCHATYLINLATDDPALLERSRTCLAANLAVARGIGASGLVLHIGSHKGSGFAPAVPQVASVLGQVLDEAAATSADDARTCRILLENAAGAGGTMGRSFAELAAVLRETDREDGLGVCLDTQHLWASGVPFDSHQAADEVVGSFDETIGLRHLQCLHLNDSKVPLGANRDRHENLGDGTIGLEGLAWLLGHPALADHPAILEVPGDGGGPRAQDIEIAHRIDALGRELRRR